MAEPWRGLGTVGGGGGPKAGKRLLREESFWIGGRENISALVPRSTLVDQDQPKKNSLLRFVRFRPSSLVCRGPSRRMGVKRSQGFILTIEDDDDVSQSESETEVPVQVQTGKNKKRKIEEQSLNPEFEFDGFGVGVGVASMEEDGWDFKGIGGVKESSTVDLEEIIARRRANVVEESEEEEVEDESEDSDGSKEFQGFDDDEIIGNEMLCPWLILSSRWVWNGG